MHRYVAVILPRSTDQSGAQAAVSAALAPLEEGLPVEWREEDGEGYWHNPLSQWDWWRVGGRWDGAILGLEPLDDPRGGFNFGDEYETVARNLTTCAAFAERIRADADAGCYAVLVPAGEEPATWFDSEGKSYPDWIAALISILDAHADYPVVGCDLHI